jgi:CRP-like cAMP-binding protein
VPKGMRRPGAGGNRILAGLPREDYERLLPSLERVTLRFGQVLSEPGAVLQHAYFLETAIVSMLSLAEDGTSIEVSRVGSEGMIGVPIVLRSNTVPYRLVVQNPGVAWRMRAEALRKEFDLCGALHRLLMHYIHTLIVQLSQSGVCNRFHTLQQRLCRWLLSTQDRAGSNEVQATQEFLAQMLGVNRGSASAAASALQKAKHIRYSRGRITILNRPGLEAGTCQCYRVIKAEFDRFFHP